MISQDAKGLTKEQVEQYHRDGYVVVENLIPAAKGMHQDAPYWAIEPMEECSCWFAIDDATPRGNCRTNTSPTTM